MDMPDEVKAHTRLQAIASLTNNTNICIVDLLCISDEAPNGVVPACNLQESTP